MKYLKIFFGFVVLALAFVSVISVFVILVFGATFRIPSTSMMPTIEVGDYILVNKLAYIRSKPAHNDIIVFRWPGNNDVEVLGRVIGLPGDTLSLHNTDLFRNEQRIDEPHAIYVQGGRNSFSSTKVREGCLYVMGDNRDQSRDSRLYSDYCVPLTNVKGRVMTIFWNSVDHSRIGFVK